MGWQKKGREEREERNFKGAEQRRSVCDEMRCEVFPHSVRRRLKDSSSLWRREVGPASVHEEKRKRRKRRGGGD